MQASEWKESVDPASGDTFYYNVAGETRWDAPDPVGMKEPEEVNPVPESEWKTKRRPKIQPLPR